MPNNQLTIQVPGKLMVAGEFAVLEPYQKLVVMAVDRFVYATIESSETNRLTLTDFNLTELTWHFINNKVTVESDDPRINFVEDAMTIVLNYLAEQSIALKPFTLKIHSELDDESGVKYGLGSSAAVVVSVIHAILEKHLSAVPDNETLFKLAAISHIKTQGNGSGADIAASVYGGLLEYSSFQAEWLKTAYENRSTISELVSIDWLYLSIRSLIIPENAHFCVGWTGTPASTKQLVNIILSLKTSHPTEYAEFLTTSEAAVATFINGIETGNLTKIYAGIEANRLSLRTVGELANIEIETPLLEQLSTLAKQENGAGKLSGAGGGDCGIAVVSTLEEKANLHQAWTESAIKPLEIDLSEIGSTAIK